MGVVKGLLHTTNPSVCLLCRLENHRPFIKEQPEQARSALGHHLGFLKCDRGLRSQGTQFTYIVMIEGRPTFNHTLLYLSAVQYYLHAVVSKAPTPKTHHLSCIILKVTASRSRLSLVWKQRKVGLGLPASHHRHLFHPSSLEVTECDSLCLV